MYLKKKGHFFLPTLIFNTYSDTDALFIFSAKGIAEKSAAGNIASIAKQAAQLHPNSSSHPVICIESETGSVYTCTSCIFISLLICIIIPH